MILFKKAADLLNYHDLQKRTGLTSGFVPTMGALHPGHLSLVESSRKDNSITICSIFVNPAQFNDSKDFEKYPVTLEEDIYKLESAGCDILYLPSVAEIYPDGTTGQDHYDIGYLESILEGKYRPGHFQGVCKVMSRLLNTVRPDNLYLGQKDYQQSKVIAKLADLMGMTGSMNVITRPTLRESDGLAMSSRNVRLNNEERQKAPTLFKALKDIKNNLQHQDLHSLKKNAEKYLHENSWRIDYIEIADAATLQLMHQWDAKQKLVVLAAAFLNEVRLIDNIIINPDDAH